MKRIILITMIFFSCTVYCQEKKFFDLYQIGNKQSDMTFEMEQLSSTARRAATAGLTVFQKEHYLHADTTLFKPYVLILLRYDYIYTIFVCDNGSGVKYYTIDEKIFTNISDIIDHRYGDYDTFLEIKPWSERMKEIAKIRPDILKLVHHKDLKRRLKNANKSITGRESRPLIWAINSDIFEHLTDDNIHQYLFCCTYEVVKLGPSRIKFVVQNGINRNRIYRITFKTSYKSAKKNFIFFQIGS